MSIVLAIESAVLGGSLSILDEAGNVLVEAIGKDDVSRAENLLLDIDRTVKQSGTRLSDIFLIAVSNGPGSYTGIRIGIASALGLGRSLRAACVGVSLLEAVAVSIQFTGTAVVAVPFGKHGIAWQPFIRDETLRPSSEARSGHVEEIVDSYPKAPVIVPPGLQKVFSGASDRRVLVTDANLAKYIGKTALISAARRPPKALYVRAADNRIARKE